MSEIAYDLDRAARLTEGPICLNATAEDDVRKALARVVEQAKAAASETDLYAALRDLTAVRDACIGAALTIKAVADEARDHALKHIGKAA
jgi:hypothetical protein